jgi:hexokinase
MYDVDQFCFYPYGDNVLAGLCEGSDDDVLTLYEIIDASFERAARLTTVIFAGILMHTGCGKNPTRPVCVTAEGTTFYKSKLFRQKLDYYVRSYLNDTLGVYVEFTRAENATLVGTAVAALLN